MLPDELFGLPVTALSDRALSPTAGKGRGEEVQILCGREDEWDNRAIEELVLPACLEKVGSYAFFGCRGLKTLHLHDRVKSWGGGCFVNCGRLSRIELHRVSEKQGESLAFICAELHDELDVSIYDTDGGLTRLIFPGFSEDYEENFANHFFDYSMAGGGYPYHHVFEKKQLDLAAYDGLWEKYLKEQYDSQTALRLAFMRLRHPVALSSGAEARYRAHLRENAAEALLWALSLRDGEGLSLLLRVAEPSAEALHLACERARELSYTEALALLLQKQHEKMPRGLARDFEL